MYNRTRGDISKARAKTIQRLIGPVKRAKIFAIADKIAKKYNWKKAHTKRMWVSKGKGQIRRGTEIIDKETVRKLQEQGEEFRTIDFIEDKMLRSDFKELARAIDQTIPAGSQLYGFTHGNSGTTLMTLNRNYTNALEVDLKDAFHQMTGRDIYYILHISLDINKKLATWLTQWAESDGVAAMGAPFVPTLFNLWLLPAIHSWNKWHTDYLLTSYADDLTLFGNSRIPWKIRDLLHKHLKRYGIKLNRQKSRFQNSKGGIVKLGYVNQNNHTYTHNIREYAYKAVISFKYGHMNKHGKPIDPEQRAMGIMRWTCSEYNTQSTQKVKYGKEGKIKAFQTRFNKGIAKLRN